MKSKHASPKVLENLGLRANQLSKYLFEYWKDEINIDGDMYETEVDIAIRLLERLRGEEKA